MISAVMIIAAIHGTLTPTATAIVMSVTFRATNTL